MGEFRQIILSQDTIFDKWLSYSKTKNEIF